MRALLPPGWPRPSGFSNAISARGRTIFTAGIIGWDETGTIVAPDLAGQLRQILLNTLAILAEDGAGPEHIVRMTWYVVDIDEYRLDLAGIGAAYQEVIGRHFPAMAVVEVGALVEPRARIEIETTAVVPEW
ncbi:MAG TPA: RidA family protein [Allosphingosinicella sp.]|jgi:enamine deaminase RidA (YjgF/YER057c/UK114 family)